MYTIAIVVPSNLFETNGSTIRARRVIPIIKNKYAILVITRSSYVDYDLLHQLGISSKELKISKWSSKNPYLDIFLQFLWNLELFKILIKNKVEMIYGQELYQFPAYCLASRIRRCKFIYEAHSLTYKEQMQTSKLFALFIYLMEFIIGKFAHGIIALSSEAYRFYQRLNNSVFYVPTFIDTKLYYNRRKFMHETLKKRVGLIGPFEGKFNRYQLDFLLSNLEAFDKRICFVLIGKCNKLLHSSKVVRLGYLKNEQDYIKALSELDAIIVPVKIGTFGPKNKILEAMACSLPVFTVPQGVISLDFARSNENIFIFEEKDLINKINELIFNESLLRIIGENARKTVESYYSKSLCEQKLLKALEKIIHGAH